MANKKILIGCGAIVVVVGLVLVVLFAVLTGAGDWVNKYFRPGPAAGTYPPEIAGFKLDGQPKADDYLYKDTETSQFKAIYKNGDKVVKLDEFVFKTPEDALATLNSAPPQAGDVGVKDKTRAVYYQSYNGIVVEVVLGNTLLAISPPDIDTAIEFEKGLPYQAFGATPPPVRVAADYGERTVSVLGIVAEAHKDPKAAAAKYDGKTMLLYGTLSLDPTAIKDAPVTVTISDSSSVEKMLDFVTVTFTPADSANAAKLKKEQRIVFRGTVKVDPTPKGVLPVDVIDATLVPNK